MIVCLSKVKQVAIEVAFSTVDQTDIRGKTKDGSEPPEAVL
jgi:hypothetical protein